MQNGLIGGGERPETVGPAEVSVITPANWDFPGDPVVKNLPYDAGDAV